MRVYAFAVFYSHPTFANLVCKAHPGRQHEQDIYVLPVFSQGEGFINFDTSLLIISLFFDSLGGLFRLCGRLSSFFRLRLCGRLRLVRLGKLRCDLRIR